MSPIRRPRRIRGRAAAAGARLPSLPTEPVTEQRPVSRRDAIKFAMAPFLMGLGTLPFDGQQASAANIRLIDFAERRIPPDQIKSAGYAGVVNYVSLERPGAHFEAKPITREYADALRAAGLHIVSNFQYGKPGWPDPSDFTRGYDGGVADAHTALGLHAPGGTTGAWPTHIRRWGCT